MARHEKMNGGRIAPISDAEDARLTAAAAADPDNPPLTDAELARVSPVQDDPALAGLLRRNGKLAYGGFPTHGSDKDSVVRPSRDYIDENDDITELGAQWFREARPTSNFPELVEILEKNGKPGRPPLPEEERKKRVTLYPDRDVIDRLKADGRGWQTRADAALRKALGL